VLRWLDGLGRAEGSKRGMLGKREIGWGYPTQRWIHLKNTHGIVCRWRLGRTRGIRQSLTEMLALLIASSLLCALLNFPTLAEVAYSLDNPNNIRRLVISINKSEVIRLDRGFGDLLVGNSEIADVVPLTTSSFYVLGKQVGATRISIVSP